MLALGTEDHEVRDVNHTNTESWELLAEQGSSGDDLKRNFDTDTDEDTERGRWMNTCGRSM